MNTENNKIIAEFMGLTIITDGISFFDTSYKPIKKYNEDWNWLMEVVEKIDYLERNKDDEFFVEKISKVTSLPLFTPKHTVYNACIEFIKWHNEQKN